MRQVLRVVGVGAVGLAACVDDGRLAGAGDLAGSESASSSDESDTRVPDLGESSGDGDDGDGDGDGGGDGDGDGDGDPAQCDPTPSSWDPWIGGPCMDDLDCGYSGGVCLREHDGWPCGSCSLPCELYCPDVADAPETFCVAHDYVDPFAPSSGACLQKCDPSLLPSGGCRPGYSCGLVERHSQPGSWAAVCLPGEVSPAKSECQQALDQAGLLWVPAFVPVDHPATHPELDCIIDDPVRLFSPINGIDYRYISHSEPTPMLVSCELALALHELGSLLQNKGAIEVAHIGTYNCRVIGGTNTLSEHGFGRAIDLGGFTLTGGQYLTVLDDWEDGVAEPVTFAGQWLRDLTARAPNRPGMAMAMVKRVTGMAMAMAMAMASPGMAMASPGMAMASPSARRRPLFMRRRRSRSMGSTRCRSTSSSWTPSLRSMPQRLAGRGKAHAHA